MQSNECEGERNARGVKMLAAEVDRLPSGLTVPVLQMLSNELKTLSGRAASAAKESERE